MRKILIAYDGSDGVRRALEAAVELVPASAAVSIVGVAEGVPMMGYAGTIPSPEQEEERRKQLEEAEKTLTEHGITSTSVMRSGDAAAAILDEAEREGVDLVVLGTRGLGTAQRWLMGSVSTKVLHHAHCSVLVVR